MNMQYVNWGNVDIHQSGHEHGEFGIRYTECIVCLKQYEYYRYNMRWVWVWMSEWVSEWVSELVTVIPYGDKDNGHHWLRLWLVLRGAKVHQKMLVAMIKLGTFLYQQVQSHICPKCGGFSLGNETRNAKRTRVIKRWSFVLIFD